MTELLSEWKGSVDSPVVILFASKPERRDEVIRELSKIGDLSIYGLFSEKEGMAKIEALDRKVDLVIIGGQYSQDQRLRIREWVRANIPLAEITEPGFEYPYSNKMIVEIAKEKLSGKLK